MAYGMWCLSASSFVPPSRAGVGPSCVGLPPGPWHTLLDFLVDRFKAISRERWLERLQRGDVVDEHGVTVTLHRPYEAHLRLYYYRDVPFEPAIPFHETILFQDAHLLVIDKPHFLPVVPSGGYLQETVLVRLKRQLGIDTLVPIHRIDRDTAGLVMLSVRPDTRAPYHALFSQRAVHKTYEAIAPWRADLTLPLTRESRIVEAGHFMLQHEVEGPANAITRLDVLEVRGDFARYTLQPVTGQRHQLRVHMAALGLPIVGDGLYPTLTPEGQIDYAHPLQLLAKSIEFVDPLSGEPRRFQSRRHLSWGEPAP
jgi:tRNA pseudouridine32 synthase/23S rRNA pseudouridine746 synthase